MPMAGWDDYRRRTTARRLPSEPAFEAFKRELEITTDRIRSAQIIARAIVQGQKDMSITGADSFAVALRERLAASKQRIAAAHEQMNGVLKRADAVGEQAEAVTAEAEREVTALESELRQLSNFSGQG